MSFALVFLGLVVIFSYGMGNVAAANNTTGDNIYVDTHGNDSWDGLSATHSGSTGPKLTIQNATGTVNMGGTVNIANGYYSGTKNNNITIDKDMNIVGQSRTGTIISGSDINSIFYIPAGINVTITNLTLTNGTSQYGGAIYNQGTLTTKNCNLNFNKATSDDPSAYNVGVGGAIYNAKGGILCLNDTYFSGNDVSDILDGGAIYNVNGATTKINDCIFTNNNANKGGAIYNEQGSLIITNSNFIHNIAYEQGGAIWNTGVSTVNNSNFTNNTCTYGDGGAIRTDWNLTVTNCNFTSNFVGDQGSAIANFGTLSITGSILRNNTATEGAAIYNCALSNFITNINFNQFIQNIGIYVPSAPNIISSLDNVNAELNWWGSNNGPTGIYMLSDGLDPLPVNTWLVLTVAAKSNTINTNSQSTITADLLHDNLGVYHNPNNGCVSNGIQTTYTTTLGTINSPVSMVNGIAISTLKSGTTVGTATIYTKLDNQTIKTLVTIKDPNPLKVSSITPANNAQNISLTAPIIIKFTENIAAGANYSKIYVKNLTTGKIVTITKTILGNTLTIKQTTSRLKNDTYQIYIPSAAVKDKPGNNSETYTSKFKTT